jgi:hypothetical protein
MEGALKQVRFPIIALFGLLAVSAVVLLQRHRLFESVAETECLVVQRLLMDLKPDKVLPGGLTEEESELAEDSQGGVIAAPETEVARDRMMKDFGSLGVIEAFGQYSDTPYFVPHKFKTRMIGGGWLVFEIRKPDEKRFSFPPEDPDESETEADPSTTESETGSNGSGHSGRLHAERKLYYVQVIISSPSDDAKALVGGTRELIFTNLDYDDNDLEANQVPGRITTRSRSMLNGKWSLSQDAETLDAKALENCRAHGIIEDDVNPAYLRLRSEYERQEVTLPILDFSVDGGSFLRWTLAISIAMSAWTSFLFREIRRHAPREEKEPWLLLAPLRNLRHTHRWESVVAKGEIVLFGLFHLAASLAPMIIAVLMVREEGVRWLDAPLLLLGVLFSTSVVFQYVLIERIAWSSAKAASL